MNIFQGSIHRLSETITVWSVEGGAMLMGHPVFDLPHSQLGGITVLKQYRDGGSASKWYNVIYRVSH